jgi:osmotically-inducible protein OsmY
MRTLWIVAGALVAIGCSHEERTTGTTAMSEAKGDFASAYDAVKSGTERTATAGKYALKDAGQGVVRVTDKSKEALGKSGEWAEDNWITTKIKSKYAVDKDVKMTRVHVDTDHGVVRLSGVVESPFQAQKAIQDALEIKGVVAVDSNLQYPTGRQAPQIYTPKKPEELPPPPSQPPPY